MPTTRISCLFAVLTITTTAWLQTQPACAAGSPAPAASRKSAQLRPVDYVNPLIGTAPLADKETLGNMPAPGEQLYTGTVNPGALVPDPNGRLMLGPVSSYDGRGGHMRGSGYRYEDGSIMGFTHFNAEYSRDNNLLFMPTVGAIKTSAGKWSSPPSEWGYRSLKDTQREKASAGYYTVFLTTCGIQAELTATKNCGFHRYTFPASQQANVLIDLANCRPGATDAAVTVVDKRTIEGFQLSGRNKIYFRAMFNKDFASSGTWKDGVVLPDTSSTNGSPIGAYATFNTAAGETILVKVGTSKTSQADAANNLAQEIPGMDFDVVHQEAVSLWSTILDHIVVEGGTEADRINFYSSMYRMAAGPQYGPLWMDFCGSWGAIIFARGSDWFGKRTANLSGSWGGGGYWGIGTAWAPLGMYNRGFTNVNLGETYPKIREQAMTGGTGGAPYRQYGYVPPGTDRVPAFMNQSLGLAFDDYVVAQYAKILGKSDDYDYFLERSRNYKKVYNSSVGFFMPRNADGSWKLVDPIDVHAEDIYREGNAWNYLFYVMHDIPGLIELQGGTNGFIARLDELFTTPFPPKAIGLRDCTGLIGLYSQANEHYRHIPYLYNYVRQPWKTQAMVRKIQKLLYRPDPTGMCGMDDHGMLTGWFVSSAMGFYHVDPTTGDCDVNSPLFPRVTIKLDGPAPGKFVIEAHNVSDTNIYIQSATLNGKPLNVPKFHHFDVVPGGILVFEMGPTPNYNWGIGKPTGK